MDLTGSKNATSPRSCKCRKCCCIVGITVLVIIVLILAVGLPLALKVFKVKNPTIKINSMSVEQPAAGDSLPTVMVTDTDASVNNPNVLALYYKNPNITVYYHDLQVAQAEGSPGVAPAHGTVRMKTKLNLNITELLNNDQFVDDFGKGEIGLNTTILVGGKVEILGVIPHHVDIEFKCILKIDVDTFKLKNQTCTQQMWFWSPKPKN